MLMSIVANQTSEELISGALKWSRKKRSNKLLSNESCLIWTSLQQQLYQVRLINQINARAKFSRVKTRTRVCSRRRLVCRTNFRVCKQSIWKTSNSDIRWKVNDEPSIWAVEPTTRERRAAKRC